MRKHISDINNDTKTWGHIWPSVGVITAMWLGTCYDIALFAWIARICMVFAFLTVVCVMYIPLFEIYTIKMLLKDGSCSRMIDHFTYSSMVASALGLGLHLEAGVWAIIWWHDLHMRNTTVKFHNQIVDLMNQGLSAEEATDHMFNQYMRRKNHEV
jgi:hypothetical protein